MRFLTNILTTALGLSLILIPTSAFAQVKVVNMIPNSLSAETQRDSEPNVAVNPANPMRIAASAFTPDPGSSGSGPIFVSTDGGNTWVLNVVLPGGNKTGDTSIRFAGTSGVLYGGILRSDSFLRMNILRKADFTSLGLMDVLLTRDNEDQPWLEAATAVAQDRVFVGNNNFGVGSSPRRTASVDLSQNAATAPAPAGLSTTAIEARSTGTANQDGPAIRTAHHSSGRVYAVFYAWTASSGSTKTSDIVVVRDDNWGASATPFAALTDGGVAGRRVVTGTTVVFNQMLGNQRTGGQATIAVDPSNSSTVYIAWGDGTPFTLHLRRSTDQGVTWSGDLRTITSATNPALAITTAGKVGFLYQRLVTPSGGNRWETHLEQSTDGFASAVTDTILANVPDSIGSYSGPNPIGDYSNLMAVGKNFYGVFSAFNTPVNANFPLGVTYQRNANFGTNQLLALNGTTVVADSIDPFFFSVSESGNIVVPSGVAFGTACAGSIGHATLNVCNTGGADLKVTGISSSNPAFAVTTPSGGFPVVIHPGACFPFDVTFTPSGTGPQSGTITISSDDAAHPTVGVPATGQSAAGSLGLSPNQQFPPTVIQSVGPCRSSRPFVVSNTGTCDLTITNIAIGGVNAGDYTLSGLPAFPITLQPGHQVGSGDLNVLFEPKAVARERTANVSVTFVSNPTSGATSVQTRELCGEGVLTGARVLVTQGGVPVPVAHEISLRRYWGGWFGFSKKVEEVDNAPLQTVTGTPGTACGSIQFHREYGGVSNQKSLTPGVYKLKVELKIAGKEVSKTVRFNVDTCGFNGTIVVDF
ncbi:MAG TPA: choice-of-anchor D domain-containing protein [Pyrinomonadaceae bacterium]|nr:choice-of-anchor D domain-containing protein [Pyrinomonadaceae bacterium]